MKSGLGVRVGGWLVWDAVSDLGWELVWGLMLALMLAAVPAVAEAPAAANAAFDAYVRMVEARLARQHASKTEILAPADEAQLRSGELAIEKLGDGQEIPGGMLHHWRATVLIPNGSAADFEWLMRDFAGYPKRFAPQVLETTVLAQHGDRYQVRMRVRQKHVITVVMDSTYDANFTKLGGTRDGGRGYSISRSSDVREIDNAGKPDEKVLGAEEEHGFLWRQNTYWSYEQRDGGLMVQVESVSLTRGIPGGLAWAIGPFVESVPRESLEFTLGRVRDALKK